MLVGQGASPEQAAAAIAASVDAGHVLTFEQDEQDEHDHPEQHDDPDAGESDVPAAESLLSLADIGMAEESAAEALLHLTASAEVSLVDLTHGGECTAPNAVDLRTLDVVAAATVLERLAESDRITLIGDTSLPSPSGPGQVATDLFAVASALGFKVQQRQPDVVPGEVIARLCAGVRAGTLTKVDDPTREVVVVRAADGAEAAHRAHQLVTDSLPRALGLRGDDVAVVTPVRRGPAGVDALRAAGLPAFTVRQAVGRTWAGVVAVIPPEACAMLSRPLVYAMFSRAVRHLSVVHAAGPVLATAVRDTGARPRRTRLASLVREHL
jgi:hypothetical protein